MERAGIVLLPVLLLAAAGDEAERLALPGPRAPAPIACTEPSLLGTRPLRLRGSLTDVAEAPWVVIAERAGAPPDAYDDLTRHLASHGCAAIVVARSRDEPWWRYAEVLGAAIWQVRAQLATEGAPLRGRIDGAKLLLVGDGDGAAAAARVAAGLAELRGLVLIDPGEPGAALPWLAQTRVPFLAVATASPESAAAQRWFEAVSGSVGRRWMVEFETERPLAASPDETGAMLRRDVRAVVAAFAHVELELSVRRLPDFAAMVRRGRIDRRVVGDEPAPLARGEAPDQR